jgi:hypothetical protein
MLAATGPWPAWVFDAFFFDTAILPEEDSGFCIGGPWWDYWFPLACEVAGARIETLAAPILMHKVHPRNYSLGNEINGCQQFWTAVKKWYADDRSIPSWPFGEMYNRYRTQDKFPPDRTGDLSALVRPWIRKNAARTAILPTGMSEIEAMLRLGGDALLNDAEFHDLSAALAAVRNSIFWRVTAPLRRAVRAAWEFRQWLGRRLPATNQA